MNLYNRTLWVVLAGGIFYSQLALPQSPDPNLRADFDSGLDGAVARVRERTGGRVLSAETRDLEGRPTYIVRILTKDGKVRRFRTDAATGQREVPRRKR